MPILAVFGSRCYEAVFREADSATGMVTLEIDGQLMECPMDDVAPIRRDAVEMALREGVDRALEHLERDNVEMWWGKLREGRGRRSTMKSFRDPTHSSDRRRR
jgi:hypothetical protein